MLPAPAAVEENIRSVVEPNLGALHGASAARLGLMQNWLADFQLKIA